MTDTKATSETEPAAADVPEKNGAGTSATGGEKGNGVSSKVWMGTAVGVGSAALVAALMYARRRK